MPRFHTSVEVEPTHVDEYESDSETELMKNEDKKPRDFPIIRYFVTRCGPKSKASAKFDL